jgi:hypothetical protein
LDKAVQSDAVKAAFAPSLFRVSLTKSPEEASKWIQSEIDHWKKITSQVDLSKK